MVEYRRNFPSWERSIGVVIFCNGLTSIQKYRKSGGYQQVVGHFNAGITPDSQNEALPTICREFSL